MTIHVLDDVIPEHLQDYFELSILGKSGDKAMHPIISLKCKYEDTAVEEDGQYAPMSFVHILRSSNTLSEHLPNFGLIPQLACASKGMMMQEILLGRIFLILPYETKLEHYAPHIDLPFQHTVVLYFVNDCDGDTVFFNDKNEVVKTVSPKRGRIVMFDGLLYHGGGIPKKGPRCAINFDIIIQDSQ
jgi:hypothetical protein